MRFIPTRIHGYLDYVMGVVLIAAPWILGFADTGAGMLVPVILGAGLILYSLFTNYELGAVRAIPMSIHLVLDFVAGLLLAVSPWLFGFADDGWVPHVVVGVLEMGVAVISQTVPSGGATGRAAPDSRPR